MKFGSLFSGIEAASAAWLPLGWVCAWVAEIDPFACAVLRHHYPDTPNLGDITRVNWDATEPVDLVVGGPPCQDFSVAGKRAGLDGERGDLSLAYVRALDTIDPAWSLTENVPGWLSMGDNAFGRFLAAMVGSGAPLIPRRGQRWTDAGLVTGPKRTAAWRVLDAQFHGVPQRRRRVFVIAVRGAGNWACADALFPQQQSVPRNFAPRRQAGEGVAPSLTVGAHGSSGHQYRQRGNEDALIAQDIACPVTSNPYGDHESREGLLIAFSAKDHGADAGDTAPTLRAGGHDRSHANAGVMPAIAHYQDSQLGAKQYDTAAVRAGRIPEHSMIVSHSLRADGFDAGEDGTGRGTPLVAVDWQNSAGGPNSEDTFMTLGSRREPAVMTLAIRGRGDSHDLEYRDDGIANAVLTPSGGRAGIGVGAVAFDTTQITSPGNVSSPKPGDPCHPLASTAHPPAVAFAQNQRGECRTSEIAAQLTTGGGKPGEGYPAAMQGMSVRRLTPVECERLQGFPDGWTDVPYRGKPASDGPRYRAIGNSMAVPVVRWLGQRIQAFDYSVKL